MSKIIDYIVYGVSVVGILLCLLALLTSCKTCQCLPEVITRDSIRVEYKRDSIYEHDSIYIDRYRTNDTVYLTKERWSIRYRDVLHTDTMYVDKKVVEVKTERYVPTFYKWCAGIVICLIVILVMWVIMKIGNRFYLR